MERAVELKLLGFKWGEIEKATSTPHSTIMRWYATEEWKTMEADWLARDPLARLAKAIIGKALMQEFLKKGRPDTALAERILARYGNGDGVGQGYGIVLVPLQDKGLASRPTTQVLVEPSRKECRPTARRRRVVGPDD